MRRVHYQEYRQYTLSLPGRVPVEIHVSSRDLDAAERLYLASNLNGWHPCHAAAAFERRGAHDFALTLSVPQGVTLEFKVTRGDWERAEVAPGGEPGENHVLKVDGPLRHEVTINDWADQYPAPDRLHTLSGDVRNLGAFPIAALDRQRQIVVYLPPGYDDQPERRYPVMYMFDGQNLFDEATAFGGEWHVDETCEALIASGALPPLIVVGIFNGKADRLDEQAPWANPAFEVLGEGRHFAEWVATDLRREMDFRFRTLGDPTHTGIGGSSMGGLTALYAAFRFPEVFGRVLAMSPSIWFNRERLYTFVRRQGKAEGMRVYLDCGYQEEFGRNRMGPMRRARRMAQLLRDLGFEQGQDLLWVEDPAGQHGEADWARRLPGALEFLWGAPSDRSSSLPWRVDS